MQTTIALPASLALCVVTSMTYITLMSQVQTSLQTTTAQLDALTRTHDGVLSQLKEASDKAALSEHALGQVIATYC